MTGLRKIATTITYAIDEVRCIRNTIDLIPNLIIFGCDELIPGIEGEEMPRTTELSFQVPLINTFDVYLERIIVKPSTNIENSI